MLIEIDGHRIEIARPEKWVWYAQRYTIVDLAKYYVAVWPWLLPHIEQRPLVYERYPGTIDGPHSFEQDPPADAPRWVRTARVPGHERTVTYVIADSPATLVYLVSQFAVTLHIWESTMHAIESPDFLLLDLDPGDRCTLAHLAQTALLARERLAAIGLNNALVKTSGARGLHVVVPIEPEFPYKDVRTFAKRVAEDVHLHDRRGVTLERDPHDRDPHTVYADWGQVGRGMTVAAPYAARACDGAPVSMPVPWSEIETFARSRARKPPIETFKRYNIGNVPELLRSRGDAWAGMRRVSLRGMANPGRR